MTRQNSALFFCRAQKEGEESVDRAKMSVGFPAIDSYHNTIPTRTLDPTTVSGFTEDANVTHAYYTQLSDGWMMQSGRTTTASLDRDGRLRTVSYRFQLPFAGWASGDKNAWVKVHEFGDLIVLEVDGCVGADMTAAPITADTLPASLRPTSPKYGVISVLNNGANAIGTVYIVDSFVSIYGGAIGTNFTNAAGGGFSSFSITYDRRD